MIVPRSEIVAFIEGLLDGDIKPEGESCCHFGVVGLRMVLDKIYGNTPIDFDDFLFTGKISRKAHRKAHFKI